MDPSELQPISTPAEGPIQEPAPASRVETHPIAKKPPVLLPPSPQAVRQLEWFQSFYAPADEIQRLSNVIEIWDTAPKYVSAAAGPDSARRDYLERHFEWKGRPFRVRVLPATLIGENGEASRRFPSFREELVEAALRKIALNQTGGFVATRQQTTILGVRFSLSMLRRELARNGHAIKYRSLMESLFILSRSQVEIASADADYKTFLFAAILPALSGVTLAQWRADPEAQWSAHFHPMIAQGLSSIGYRQFDYDTVMGYRSALARFLHKHLAAVFTNAGMTTPYRMKLTDIIHHSGLLNHSRLRDAAVDLDNVLDELLRSVRPIVRSIERHPVYEGRRLADMLYTFNPSPDFIRLVVAANKRQADARQQPVDNSGITCG